MTMHVFSTQELSMLAEVNREMDAGRLPFVTWN